MRKQNRARTTQHRRKKLRKNIQFRIIVMIGLLIGVLGCADAPKNGTSNTNSLTIRNLRITTITQSNATVEFTINKEATCMWVVYKGDTDEGIDLHTVVADAQKPPNEFIILNSGVTGAIDATAGAQSIELANLARDTSYSFYLVASDRSGQQVRSEKLPIKIVSNISEVRTVPVNGNTVQIEWRNPPPRDHAVLEKVEIGWNTIDREGRQINHVHASTNRLAAGAMSDDMLSPLPAREAYQFSLTAVYRDGSRLTPVMVTHYLLDNDGDRLIDIYDLEGLSNIRCNPSGAAYQALESDGVTCSPITIRCGADGTIDCIGYELQSDLNFRRRGGYSSGATNSAWQSNTLANGGGRPTTSERGQTGGWRPIDNFSAIFEGNGHTIANLYVRETTGQNYQLSGLFARISDNEAHIRNVILKSATIYGGDGNYGHVGTLAGELSGGTIENVAVIGGRVDGENGAYDRVGGLIGQNAGGGTVRNSYATATVYGGEGGEDAVGGLVGRSHGSTITASHAAGNAHGSEGIFDRVGGLVGRSIDSAIVASYATGDVDGGEGTEDRVGGLVGRSDNSAITASYATGNANGGNGSGDWVGGLIGNNVDETTIVASYATGNADGGSGHNDYAGGLVGRGFTDAIIASYATGNAQNGYPNNIGALIGVGFASSVKNSYGFGSGGRRHSSPLPPGASRASHLTAPVASDAPNTAVPHVWDSVAEQSKDAWDFGTSAQEPALKYADYDGDGDAYSCDLFPAPCGTLIPGQR